MSLSQRDKKIIWHPFTQEKHAAPVISVKKAQGCYLYDEQNTAYLDLISSWWVNIHGHCHPEIAQSIYEQAITLEHVLFAGFTHEPAITLCEELQSLLPKTLSKFFFSDNGSTAVEVALKMAYQYWHNLGKHNKTKFLSFAGGYHGDTFGAMAVGASSGFHQQFQDLFFEVMSIPYPDTWENDTLVARKEQQALQVLAEYLTNQHANIAALILEPLVQGASGMRMCRPEFLNAVINLVKEHQILVIFDEVMTGFGRTGTNFALEQLAIPPDFLCISKGITGGFLPLALTVTTDTIFSAFLADDFKKAFAHGHSYTANPIACQAAVTSLRLLNSPQCQNSITKINQVHQQGLSILSKHAKISKLRATGTIAAFTVDTNIEQLKQRAMQHGLLIRPLGNTVYLLPPYCISEQELLSAYDKILAAV